MEGQIEKNYVGHVSSWQTRQSASFQIKFGKKPVAGFSKECAFLLSQRKVRCAVIYFFGVGGSGRRPLESADPGLGVAVD